ncbi:MAG: hypothetical protein CENE_03749 [Candidatus Celerinatantimonas neptuna]|nr:MAG: hypothetical protein CENE_03749 [Candidatus Celerinatantimonas neptuna]
MINKITHRMMVLKTHQEAIYSKNTVFASTTEIKPPSLLQPFPLLYVYPSLK